MIKYFCYCLPFVFFTACNSGSEKPDNPFPINYKHEAEPETGINILEPNWAYRFNPSDKGWIDDVAKRSYVGVYSSNGNYTIGKENLVLMYDIDECTNDSLILFMPSVGQQEPFLFIAGLKSYNKAVFINHITKGDVYMDPGEKLSFNDNGNSYALFARADSMDMEDVDNWEAVRNYELVFTDGKTEQVLLGIEQFYGTMLEAIFIGDIDGDNCPDILVNATYNHNFRNVILFLSSLAKNGELVHLSATDSRWFDCPTN